MNTQTIFAGTIYPDRFTAAAQANIEETGADVAADIAALVAGTQTSEDLLAHCLDGADTDREQGWRDYVEAVALAAEQTSAQLTPADTAEIEAAARREAYKIDAQSIDEHLDAIGETGSAKLRTTDLYTRREGNCDWLYCGTVEAEDLNDVKSILADRGYLQVHA